MECANPKPPLPGEVARQSRDGEVASNLRRPLSQPAADSSPGRGSLSEDYTRFPYRSFAFEKGGKIYEAIGIAKWQSRVPDMSRIFPKLMPAKKIPARPDEQTLLVMIRETCAAEATHALLILAGLGLLAIWPGAGGILLYLIYAIFGNLVFLIIQRYNRPRLVRLYERMCAKRSKEA